jgi:hypothetical protein
MITAEGVGQERLHFGGGRLRVFGRFLSVERELLVVAFVCVSCAAAGCGGGSDSGSGTASVGDSKHAAQYNQALKFAKCMRAHGVTNFPDPKYPGEFSGSILAAVNTQTPAFVSAAAACDKTLPNEGQPTAAEFAQSMTDDVRFAKCMRRHNVYFPDPGITGTHMTIDLSNVNTSAPAYMRAAKICETPPGG